jgi:hypothetical protein
VRPRICLIGPAKALCQTFLTLDDVLPTEDTSISTLLLMPEASVGTVDALLPLRATEKSATLVIGSGKGLFLRSQLQLQALEKGAGFVAMKADLVNGGSPLLGVKVALRMGLVLPDVNFKRDRTTTGSPQLLSSTTSGAPECARTPP